MGLIDLLFRGTPSPSRSVEVVERDNVLSLNQWVNMFAESFQFGGASYTLPRATQENISGSYSAVTQGALKENGIVFSCIATRMMLFSQARFMYRRTRGGRPGDLFAFRGDDLDVLRKPWTGGTTGDLLARMLTYVDLAGNAYVVRRGSRLTPLRPDWMTIIGGVAGDEDASVWNEDAEVLGYAYQEGGLAAGNDPVFFLPEEVAHFAPYPDPEARFRGMSWITPVVREIMSDKAATAHKLAFFENAATPNLAVKLNVDDLTKYKQWVEELGKKHDGAQNAYRTLYLGAGADVTVVGKDLQQLDFKVTQGAGETRIAAASGIHPVILGLSEGLQGSSLNAGNFQAARRLTADKTLRFLWGNACGSLANIVKVPSDAELAVDDRVIAFLQEDQKDAADIFAVDAQSYRTLVDGGVEPDSAKAAVAARDIAIVQHSGLLSVQLQEPGQQTPTPPPLADAPTPGG